MLNQAACRGAPHNSTLERKLKPAPIVAFLVSVVGLTGCSSTTVLPWAPVTIGPEWTEFKFEETIRPVFQYQEIVLVLDEPDARAQFVRTPPDAVEQPIRLTFPDGRSVDVYAESVMVDGSIRVLKAWGHACANERICDIKFGDNFKGRERIRSVRLMASTPIRVKRATWEDYIHP